MEFNYKVGDKAIIIREICGHQFQLGEVVKIIKESGHDRHFQASDGKETWYVSMDELIPYEVVKQRILKEYKNDNEI